MSSGLALGLIGWPVAYSRSPVLHAAALRAAGLQGEYRLYPVPPSPPGDAALAALLNAVRRGKIDGLNITHPHKQAVVPMLDGLTVEADAIGAVNTIYREDGRLLGDNTDASGFLADLDARLGLSAGQALILGAGGAARAVALALARRGWQVHVAARRAEQACALAVEIAPWAVKPGPLTPEALARSSQGCRLLVNATPVGSTAGPGGSAWPQVLPLPAEAAVFDLVYEPEATALVQAARAAGLSAVGGLGMLAEQAALAFARWTGTPPPRAVMRRAALAGTTSAEEV